MTDWRDRVTTSPDVCHGAACVRGTRIPVSVVLDNLADGLPAEEILASYPSLTLDDVRAAVAYGAELARERVLDFPRHAAGRSSSSTRICPGRVSRFFALKATTRSPCSIRGWAESPTQRYSLSFKRRVVRLSLWTSRSPRSRRRQSMNR